MSARKTDAARRRERDFVTASAALPARILPAANAARPISTGMVCGLLRVADFLIIGVNGAISYLIWLQGSAALDWTIYVLVALLGALFALNVFHLNRAYRWETLCSLPESVRRTLVGWAVVVAVLLGLAFLTKISDQFSRAWLLLWCILTAAILCISRIGLYLAIFEWKVQGRLRRNVVVLGLGPIGQRLIAWLANNPSPDLNVLAAFDDRIRRSPHRVWEVPTRGNVDALVEFVRHNPVDMVVVALPLSAENRLTELFEKLKALPIDVRLCLDAVGFQLGQPSITTLCQVPLLNVADRPLSGWRWSVKSIEDRVLASLILVLVGPLMLLIALAIKLDSRGPVLFRQKRYGFNNQIIEVFKFRTMFDHMRDEDCVQVTRRNDPRVTRIGRFLRRTSLDELPQFFNVLRGEMSIVGPRPHARQSRAAGILFEQAVRQYGSRHRVKPGITGWAQVNGWRGETETVEQIERRVEHDLAYIENWSLALDLKIILRTALTGFTGHRAY